MELGDLEVNKLVMSLKISYNRTLGRGERFGDFDIPEVSPLS